MHHINDACQPQPWVKIHTRFFLRWCALLGLGTALFLFCGSSVFGSELVLRVAPSGTDRVGCGSSQDPCRTIQFAVESAPLNGKILVAAGTYRYTPDESICRERTMKPAVVCILDTRLSILGGFTTSNWTVADSQRNVTIIDGEHQRQAVVMQGLRGTLESSLTMSGFVIRNGYVEGTSTGNDDATSAYGGGMYVDGSDLYLTNMVFENNVVQGGNTNKEAGGVASGGGLAVRGTPNLADLQHITFDGNVARGGSGLVRGGYAIGGGLYAVYSNLVAENLMVTDNLAQGGSAVGQGVSSSGELADALGGGIAIQVGTMAELKNIRVERNRGIGGESGNQAGGAFGGGIKVEGTPWNGAPSSLLLEDSVLRNNDSLGADGIKGGYGAGGGLESIHADVTVNRVSIINNRAIGGNGSEQQGPAAGGGIQFQDIQSGTSHITIINTNVVDNLARVGLGNPNGGGGGGIWLQGVTADIMHTTVAGNRLENQPMQGQAILVMNDGSVGNGLLTMWNSIIANHSEVQGAVALHVKPGNKATLQSTLWADNRVDTNQDTADAGEIENVDPIAAEQAGFRDPRAPQYDYHITIQSAARDRGKESLVSVDIDRQLRSRPDLGADEYYPMPIRIHPLNTRSLSVNWDPVPSALKYVVEVRHEAGASPPREGTIIHIDSETMITLTGLTPYQTYAVMVSALGADDSLLDRSDEVGAFPTDLFNFLPLIQR